MQMNGMLQIQGETQPMAIPMFVICPTEAPAQLPQARQFGMPPNKKVERNDG